MIRKKYLNAFFDHFFEYFQQLFCKVRHKKNTLFYSFLQVISDDLRKMA